MMTRMGFIEGSGSGRESPSTGNRTNLQMASQSDRLGSRRILETPKYHPPLTMDDLMPVKGHVPKFFPRCWPSWAQKSRNYNGEKKRHRKYHFSVSGGVKVKYGSLDRKNVRNSVKKRVTREEWERNKTNGKKISYADQPVLFVSSGVIDSEVVFAKTSPEDKDVKEVDETTTCNGADIGAFQVHTRGFGSKMMAKMGFEGGGLGKDGKGMAQPIEVVQRPKSLGLGAFELHRTDFGSRMGFGSESQGIVNPLVAGRRFGARGLGAEG